MLNGIYNVLITGAAAEIAVKGVTDFSFFGLRVSHQ